MYAFTWIVGNKLMKNTIFSNQMLIFLWSFNNYYVVDNMFTERLGFRQRLLLNQFFLFMFSPFSQLSTHENSMGVQINNLRIPCTHNFLFCMILMRTDLKYNEVCNYLYHLDVHMSSERKAKGIYSFFCRTTERQ